MDWKCAHRTRIQMRYSDTDMMGHINNAAYAQFLELARMEYLDWLLPPGARPVSMVLARLELNYRQEVRLGQQVEVLTLLRHVGKSSWSYTFQLLADGLLSADGSSVQVHTDPETRRSTPLPALMRGLLLAELSPETARQLEAARG